MAFFEQNNSNGGEIIYVANGKLYASKGNGQKEYKGTGFEGRLVKITEKKRQMPDGEKPFIYLHFVDGHDSFRFSCQRYDGVCNQIAQILPNVPDLGKPVVFSFWQKVGENGRNYTNLSITQAGETVRFVELPKAETIQVPSGEVFKSYRNRENFVDAALLAVQEKLKENHADESDMPDFGGDPGPGAYDGFEPQPDYGRASAPVFPQGAAPAGYPQGAPMYGPPAGFPQQAAPAPAPGYGQGYGPAPAPGYGNNGNGYGGGR